MERIEARLEILERDAIRWRRAAVRYRSLSVLVLLLAIGAIGLGFEPVPAVVDVVQTNRLEVLDEAGHLVLAASADERGGRLDVWTASGQNVFRVAANALGGDLNLWNGVGGTVFGAYATEDGGELGLWNRNGSRALRGAAVEAGGRFEIMNATGGAVAVVTSAPAGSGRLLVNNADQKSVLTVAVDEIIGGTLTLANGAGDRRTALTADNNGGAMSFYNASGQVALTCGVTDPVGGGFLDVNNVDGARVASVAAESDGCGRIDVANGTGQFVFTIDAIPDVGAALALFNAKGRKALLVGTRPEGGLMNIYNQHEVPVIVAGYGQAGLGGALSIRNGRGIPVVHAAADDAESGKITVFDADGHNPRATTPAP